MHRPNDESFGLCVAQSGEEQRALHQWQHRTVIRVSWRQQEVAVDDAIDIEAESGHHSGESYGVAVCRRWRLCAVAAALRAGFVIGAESRTLTNLISEYVAKNSSNHHHNE